MRRIESARFWVASPTLGSGYWNRAEETRETFGATLADTEGFFLRTGDLGFVRDGELFITGRIKEMVIIRGTNHAPHDIEWSVQGAHPAMRPDHGVAFSVVHDGEECLVVAQEVERDHLPALDVSEVMLAIRSAIAEEHGINVHTVALLARGTLSKTSSGKLQRQGCRSLFLSGELQTVARWSARDAHEEPPPPVEEAAPDRTESGIRRWLISRVAWLLEIDPRRIDAAEPLANYGMDSLKAVRLAGELEDRVGRTMPETLVYDHPSLDAIARFASQRGGRKRVDRHGRRSDREPLAIVGMGCRFPGAKSPDEFWALLRGGIDAITEVPASRWDAGAVYDPAPVSPGRANTRWGGFLEEIDRFDAEFFSISPKEAALVDPQHRLLLEVAWEALEHAGIEPASLAGSRTGVFIGICSNDYSRLQAGLPSQQTAYATTGNASSMAASRISYVLDLQGPSWVVDTACSSSLVALHQACQSLRAGDCDAAIVGGVNLILDPTLTVAFSQSRMMSSDGRCKAFSAAADGYGRAEGCGVVVLRPLSDARRDRDHVYAVVRGSAVNHDGRSNGITAPNGAAQESLISDALADAGVSPAEIGYVEAHGTGTALGDPIEMNALKQALSAGSPARQRCWIGSVKTNIGHAEAAAGIAGIIKVALAMDRGELPAHLHLSQLNPRITLEGTPLAIPTVRQAWPRQAERPRLAGVSSFSFGGTNAHAVLSEGPAPEQPQRAADGDRPLHLLTLSATTEAALVSLAGAFADHLETTRSDTGDVCFTANTGRSRFRHRLAVLGMTNREIAARLRDATNSGRANPVEGVRLGNVSGRGGPRIALVSSSEVSVSNATVRRLFEIVPSLRQAETDRPGGVGGTCWLPTLSPGADPWRTLLDAVATLYVAGVPIDFRRLDDGIVRRRVALPTYRFQRRRHWFREAEGTNGELLTASGHSRGSAGNARALSDEP